MPWSSKTVNGPLKSVLASVTALVHEVQFPGMLNDICSANVGLYTMRILVALVESQFAVWLTITKRDYASKMYKYD